MLKVQQQSDSQTIQQPLSLIPRLVNPILCNSTVPVHTDIEPNHQQTISNSINLIHRAYSVAAYLPPRPLGLGFPFAPPAPPPPLPPPVRTGPAPLPPPPALTTDRPDGGCC